MERVGWWVAGLPVLLAACGGSAPPRPEPAAPPAAAAGESPPVAAAAEAPEEPEEPEEEEPDTPAELILFYIPNDELASLDQRVDRVEHALGSEPPDAIREAARGTWEAQEGADPRVRARALADAAVRRLLPVVMEESGAVAEARRLRELPAIADEASALDAVRALRSLVASRREDVMSWHPSVESAPFDALWAVHLALWGREGEEAPRPQLHHLCDYGRFLVADSWLLMYDELNALGEDIATARMEPEYAAQRYGGADERELQRREDAAVLGVESAERAMVSLLIDPLPEARAAHDRAARDVGVLVRIGHEPLEEVLAPTSRIAAATWHVCAEREAEEAAAAGVDPNVPPDPHPLVAGYARALREWMTTREARALDGIRLDGTGGGDTQRLEELLRYTLFRELGGRAVAQLPQPELRRYGQMIRRLPRRPDAEGAHLDGASVAHMNVEDPYWAALGDVDSACRERAGEAPDAQERCRERLERARAAGRVAHHAYDALDVETMSFLDAPTPTGGGFEVQSPPKPLSELLADAERAGLSRGLIRRVTVDLLRRLVREARR